MDKKIDHQTNPKEQTTRIKQRIIEQEMKQSYLDYSMSVIVGRALPDIRDGLKPVQRRVLYSMLGLGLLHNKPPRKSARIVGDCLGRYHPHSDTSIYDAMVRMAQDFSLRYPLIQGQGNWGCFTGDTKVKLADGRDLSFKDLIKEHKQGKKNYTYTINSRGLIEIAEIKNPRLTKRKERIMKVVLDNGEEIRCTLNHKFMLKDGTYKEAQELRAGESLMPLYSEIVAQAKVYNHKVVKIEILNQKEDVYDLTIEGTHNFALAAGVFVHNSIDGDNAAAVRYTEARLTPLAEDLLADIDKETVKFVPNFDNSLKEPVVLPSKAPNLLINGCSGIAVGMATNIPPHNFGEIVDGLLILINNPNISIDELMQVIKGPDFPTAAIICGGEGIKHAYKTGKGVVRVRARTQIDEENRQIIVSEIPFQVNKAQMVEQIANLVNQKKIRGISDLRDESSREGIRVVIKLKRDANANIVLNQLFKHSRLELSFGINMVALVRNQPKLLNLKQMLQYFIEHRKLVVTKRTQFELKKASERAHMLDGIIAALNRIDDVINWIKKSKDVATAKSTITQKLSLTDIQAQAILDMRLQRLSSLEQEKVRKESKKLKELMLELKGILADEKRIFEVIKKDLLDLKQKYADERRTLIEAEVKGFEKEDLIQARDVVVTITHKGYIKRTSPRAYRTQQRGGKGIIATDTRQQDIVEDIFIANTHSYLLLFTNLGVVHWLKVYEIPEASRYAIGTSLMNLVKLRKQEKITAVIPVKSFDKGFLFMATKKGVVKKVQLQNFSRPRRGGIIATNLDQGDALIGVCTTDGEREIILATLNGMAIRFRETDVRTLSRTARGVRGIRLRKDDKVVAMVITDPKKTLLSVTENGYGKRSNISDYRLINRGGRGVINIRTKGRNGMVVDVKSVKDTDNLMFISKKGKAIKVKARHISTISRNTQGVTIMKLEEGDKLVAAAKVKA